MVTITVDEIQQNLLGYLQWVKAGETLIIVEAGEPLAEVRPMAGNGTGLRPYALCQVGIER